MRSTARLASLRSNCASALALSAFGAILSRSREELFLSTAASLAAKRASGPLTSPTANTTVSELRSQTRPAHTVAAVRITVRMQNRMIWVRLSLTTRERRGGTPAGCAEVSALIAHTRSGTFCRLGRRAGRPKKHINGFNTPVLNQVRTEALSFCFQPVFFMRSEIRQETPYKRKKICLSSNDIRLGPDCKPRPRITLPLEIARRRRGSIAVRSHPAIFISFRLPTGAFRRGRCHKCGKLDLSRFEKKFALTA